MDKELVQDRLNCLIKRYSFGRIVELDKDLMSGPVNLAPYDMASLFLDIKREFSIDLNELVPKLNMFSISEISNIIKELIK